MILQDFFFLSRIVELDSTGSLMATYTGQRVTWDEAINSKLDLTPESYEWGPVKLSPEALAIAMPGKTKLT